MRSNLSQVIFSIGAVAVLANCGGGKQSSSESSGHAILPDSPQLVSPTVTSAANPTLSNSKILVLEGECAVARSEVTVHLGGDANKRVLCVAGRYSLFIEHNDNASLRYTIKQTSLTEKPSAETPFLWIKSTQPPSPVLLSSPSTNPIASNADSITVIGNCLMGGTVIWSGDAEGSTTCTTGNFAFGLAKSVDGSYVTKIIQQDVSGNKSRPTFVNWVRDTQAPAVPVVRTPATSSVTSANADFVIAGTCEDGATLRLTGSTSDSAPCSGGKFSFTVTQSNDGAYSFGLQAADLAGNISASQAIQWIRDSVVPMTPAISNPALALWSSNTSSLMVSGSCTTGFNVYLTGADSQSATCVTGTFGFNLSSSVDGDYGYSIKQQSLAGIDSASTSLTWVRDATAPLVPVVTTPAASSFTSAASTFTLAGLCEANAVVSVSGDANLSTNCTSGSFALHIDKGSDGTYNFNILQTDRAGNASSQTSIQWIRDTAAPSAPAITSPASLAHLSSANSLAIQGSCEPGATVFLTGDTTAQIACASSNFSFAVAKSTDNTYGFEVYQTDAAGNTSGAQAISWIRDSVAPSAPTVASPSNPYTANASTIAISGLCETGSTVSYTGASSGSTACSAGTYSFDLSKSTDGTYDLAITQADAAGNLSGATAFQWTRLTTGPVAPLLTSPAVNPLASSGDQVTLSGACESGMTVELSGESSGSTICQSGSFAFQITGTSDTTRSYSVRQTNSVGLSSSGVAFTWIRDTVPPEPPALVSPSLARAISNGQTLAVSGTCEPQSVVSLSGDATGSAQCADGRFSFTISKSTDGAYSFTLIQEDQAGNTSASTVFDWLRDSVAPSAPVITNHAASPHVSAQTNFSLAGDCDPEAQVAVSGASSATMTCDQGKFSFDVLKSTDGTYQFLIHQTDLAGNTSEGANFVWVRDTTLPFKPTLVSPAANSLLSNHTALTISVTCDPTIEGVIHLRGDVLASEVTAPANALSQVCTSSPVQFTIAKVADGNFTFLFAQENPTNDLTSEDTVLTWSKDTSAPSALALVSPLGSPHSQPDSLLLSGYCEDEASVHLTGDSTQSQKCTDGHFSFEVIKSEDATYNFSLAQVDEAGNLSSSIAQAWIRTSDLLPAVGIRSPAKASILNNKDLFTLSGSCSAGATVTLSGDVVASDVTRPLNSLSQACKNGSFSFRVNKTTNGTFAFYLRQHAGTMNSPLVARVWTRDTIAPVMSLNAKPNSTNLLVHAVFRFESSEAGLRYQCKLDGNAFRGCRSPLTYKALSLGSHTFTVRARDSAGNFSSEHTWSWTQAHHNTVALYHLNSASATTDSGLYTQTGGFNNSLTATGAPADSAGLLPASAPSSRALGTATYYSATDNASLNTTRATMTVEGLFKLNSGLVAIEDYVTLVSKSAASPNVGWEIRLLKSATNRYKLQFIGSIDGSTSTVITSNQFAVNAGQFNYFAVTFNKGRVRFFSGTTKAGGRGSGTIGTLGSTELALTSAPLRIGAGPSTGSGSSKYFDGSIDEVRISQIVRPIAIPTQEYIAD